MSGLFFPVPESMAAVVGYFLPIPLYQLRNVNRLGISQM